MPTRKPLLKLIRTSPKFGHILANGVNPDETAPSHQDCHCLHG